MTPEQHDQLSAPFPDEQIETFRKGETGPLLTYVGHAGVTMRLLSVDPEWSWEPLAVDQWGLPLMDDQGGLWIKLTVCGVTRLGYGDSTAKGTQQRKELIGDAIRNAAMRFGVATPLWSKSDEALIMRNEEPKAKVREPRAATRRTAAAAPTPTPAPRKAVVADDVPVATLLAAHHAAKNLTDPQLQALWAEHLDHLDQPFDVEGTTTCLRATILAAKDAL